MKIQTIALERVHAFIGGSTTRGCIIKRLPILCIFVAGLQLGGCVGRVKFCSQVTPRMSAITVLDVQVSRRCRVADAVSGLQCFAGARCGAQDGREGVPAGHLGAKLTSSSCTR
eukprot:604317-Amphidinium_carterae.1